MVILKDFLTEFLNKIFEKPLPTSEPNEPKRIVLFHAFFFRPTVLIRNQVNKLFSSADPHIQVRCIFRPLQRLSAFSALKTAFL